MHVVVLAFVLLITTSCASQVSASDDSPLGNLVIRVFAPEGTDARLAELYLDTQFLGTASPELPILRVPEGTHSIVVVMAGCATYERDITVLGAPSRQLVNVFLEPGIPKKFLHQLGYVGYETDRP